MERMDNDQSIQAKRGAFTWQPLSHDMYNMITKKKKKKKKTNNHKKKI